MTNANEKPRVRTGADIANIVTAGSGVVISIGAASVLITLSGIFGDTFKIVSCSIFGGSLILLYTASTLYHSARKPSYERLMKLMDHNAIFLLIAGSYTPFALVSMRGKTGWTILAVIWTIAIAGIIYRSFVGHSRRWVTASIYLAMGWLIVVAFNPLMASVSGGTFGCLVGGGLSYTAGIPFYVLSSRFWFAHGVWHLFVLGGSICHTIAVFFTVFSG